MGARGPMGRGPLVSCAIGLLMVAGCGGGRPSADGPTGHTARQPGQACIEDARASHDVPAGAPEEIEVSHILVRHAALERPEGATRSREDACLRVLEAREKMEGGMEWDAAVAEYSDSPGAMAGGLGSVTPSDVEPAFAGAAFVLEVGQMSYVVETSRGFHLILRTE